MEPTQTGDSSNQERLERIIAEYLEATQVGSAPDREGLLKQHPELADELRAFFVGHDQMQAAAQPFRPSAKSEKSPDEAHADSALAPTVTPHEPGQRTTEISPPVGTKVRYFGDYELLQEIARGGMGVVYKARQVKLNRVVALKMILSGQFASQADVQRFYTEAEAAAGLDHPGIVPIFEVGEHEGQHYFSMGYVDGESLATKLAHSPLPPKQAAELLKSVAEAVQYAHEKGVIHRDLKPANILLDSDSQPRITDFGLAKRVQGDAGMTATGQVLGTPSYMPPEQAAGRIDQVREPADVYSLGAVLYAALTGRPPFQADNPMDTLMQVLEREPISPRQVNPSIPRDLETICLKCLQKERRRRYAYAQALVDDLARYLRGEPIEARPVGRIERATKWVRRHPARTGFLAATLIALLALVGIGVGYSYQGRLESANAELETANTKLETANSQLDSANMKLETANDELTTTNAELEQARDAEAKAKDALDQILYFRQVNLALAAWKDNKVQRARQLLAECPPERRHWEWGYVYRLCSAELLNIHGQGGNVAFSPDGRRIASGGGVRGLPQVRARPQSPDGQQIASGGGGTYQSLTIWDAETGREQLTLRGNTGSIKSVAFSPSGRFIVTGGNGGEATVWDAETGTAMVTLTGQYKDVQRVAFSPDGRWIASASWNWNSDKSGAIGAVTVFDAPTGEKRFALTLKGQTEWLMSVAFSPDGGRVVCGSNKGAVKLWNAETGEEICTLAGEITSIETLAYSPDGRRIAAAGGADGTLQVWDAETEQSTLLRRLNVPIWSVAFSPDSRRLVAGTGSFGRPGEVRVWDADNGNALLILKGHTREVRSVAFSPDGRRIASASDSIKVWDAEIGEEFRMSRNNSYNGTTTFSPDGRWIVSGRISRGELTVLDAQTGKETLTLKGHSGPVPSVAFSPDSQRIVSAGSQSIKVWSARTGEELLTLEGHTKRVCTVAVSPNGQHIASGSDDGTVKVWDTETGKEVLTFEDTLVLSGERQPVCSVVFSPDGRQIASGSLYTIKVWDATSGEVNLTLTGEARGALPGNTSVAFSPDGRRIAHAYDSTEPLARRASGTIKVWDAESGGEVFTLKGHTDEVVGLAFSPDGQRIVSLSDRGEIKFWDAQTGREAFTLTTYGVRGAAGLAFSPDGRLVASGGFVWSALQPNASEYAAVTAIEQLGGNVIVDPDSPDRHVTGVTLIAPKDSNQVTWMATQYLNYSESAPSVGDAALAHLKALPTVEFVDLSNTDTTDAGLQHLKPMTHLRTLDIGNTQVTDEGMQHLRGVTSLQSLDLHSDRGNPMGFEAASSITDSGMKHLQGLTNLEMLDLRGTRVTDAGLMHLKALNRLRSLNVEQQRITDAGLEYLQGFTKLQRLNLGATGITDSGMQYLQGLTKLEVLVLSNTTVTDAGLAHLKTLRALQTLEMGTSVRGNQLRVARRARGQISDAGLVHLKGLTSLENLHLNDTQVTDAGLLHLKGLTKLRVLHLNGTYVSDAAVERLQAVLPRCRIFADPLSAAMTAIGELGGRLTSDAKVGDLLALKGQTVTDAALVHVKNLNNLQRLTLTDTRVTDAGLVHLKDLDTLRTLTLSGARVSDAGLVHLKDLTSLQTLRLTDANVTGAGLVHLQGLAGLQTLYLDGSKLNDAGLEHLKGLTSLQHLFVGDTEVDLPHFGRRSERVIDYS